MTTPEEINKDSSFHFGGHFFVLVKYIKRSTDWAQTWYEDILKVCLYNKYKFLLKFQVILIADILIS